MNNIKLILIVYILILIVQFIYTYFNTFNLDETLNKKVNVNKTNFDKIQEQFAKILKDRVNLLYSKQMNFKDWVEYNKKNILVKIDNFDYYLFIIDDKEKIIMHPNKNYEHLDWLDVLKQTSEKLSFTKFTTSPDLLKDMYITSNLNEPEFIKYYWLDPLTLRNVEKLSTLLRFEDETTGRKGTIGIGMDINNLDIETRYKYFDIISKPPLAIVSVVLLLISIIMIYLNNSSDIVLRYKSVIFLIITNLYILYFINSFENIGSSTTENDKIKTISSSVLSVTFLITANIYIINTLSKSEFKNLFVESSIIFAISLLFLLFTLFKTTNQSEILQIIKERITTQFVFNFAILLNSIIIINYLTQVFIKHFNFKKLFKK